LHMAQLMPLPLTVSCFSEIQIGFSFVVSAHPGRPGKRAVKRVCVCVVSKWHQTNDIHSSGIHIRRFDCIHKPAIGHVTCIFFYFLVKQVTSGHLSAELQSSAICNSNAACSYSALVSNLTISRAKWTTFNVVTGRISKIAITHAHTYNRLTAHCPGTTRVS